MDYFNSPEFYDWYDYAIEHPNPIGDYILYGTVVLICFIVIDLFMETRNYKKLTNLINNLMCSKTLENTKRRKREKSVE